MIVLVITTNASAQILIGNSDYLKPTKHRIAGVRVEGAPEFDESAIILISGLTVGKEVTIPGEDISNAIKKLWEQELFSDVQILMDGSPKPNGDVYLIIKVAGRPTLSGYTWAQNGEVSKSDGDKLNEMINLFPGKRITESMVLNTQNIVRGFYQEKGYLYCNVTVTQVVDTNLYDARKFLITVEKGEKIKIAYINIYGNELEEIDPNESKYEQWRSKNKVSDGSLKRSMKDTKEKGIMRIFKRSKFNRTAYNRDKAAIEERYNAIGLRDARIIKDSVYKIDDKHIAIDIYVDQGEKYYFGEITWIGNTKYRSGQLDTLLGIKKGDVYNKALLEQRLYMSMDGRDVTSLYMDRGYLFFNIVPVEMNIDSNNYINYELRITEGKEARIKNIIIKGNTKTNDNVILREIRTKPGDLFNRNDIIRTQRELANLGYFDPEQFQVNPIPNPIDGTVDIEYTVVEKSSDQVELSGGYGANRLIGTIGLSFTNFSTKNFFKKESWQPLPSGDGQRLSIRGQTYGRGYQSYNMSFTEPWLGGKKPTSFSIFMSHSLLTNGFEKSDAGYSQTSITSLGMGLGSRLKWPDDYFQFYGELSYQYYDLRQSQYFIFSDGYSNNISLQTVISRNSISDPIYPRSGSKFSLTLKSTLPYSLFENYTEAEYEAMTDQQRYKFAEYYKIKFSGEWYIPLTQNKKLVLRPKFGFGFMGAYNPAKGDSPFERFYLGGSGLNGAWQFDGREIISLRGYDGNSMVSPLTGGTVISRYSIELRYPLSLNPSATIYGLAFVEAGNTYNSLKEFNPFNVKRACGAGVRIFLPMFGMLGVDFAWGFDPLDPGSAGFGIPSSNPGLQPKGYTFGIFPIIGMQLGDI